MTVVSNIYQYQPIIFQLKPSSSLQSPAKHHVEGGSYENLWRACWPNGTDLNTKVGKVPMHTYCMSTHSHTWAYTKTQALHAWSRHPASHKPLPLNIPHIWPFNCGPKISVITESVSTLQVNTAAEIDTSTTIYKCTGARGRFLFIADRNYWLVSLLTIMNLQWSRLLSCKLLPNSTTDTYLNIQCTQKSLSQFPV